VAETKVVDQIIDGILQREGARYTDNPADHGGPTKWGITLHELSAVRGHACSATDVKALTRAEAFGILKSRYYVRPGFQDVAAQSEPIAAELTDTGVNMGVGIAGRFLQRSLNLFNRDGKAYKDIAVDGAVGQITLGALHAYLASRPKDGVHVMLEALNVLQGERYFRICEADPVQEKFAFGWFRERVSI